jgi:hypothetical protein
MHVFGYIVVVKLKMWLLKQVFHVPEAARDQVVHGNYVVAFPDKTVA